MSTKPYIIWDGKEENDEPENREDIRIILAHGTSKTSAFHRVDESGNESAICTSKIHGGWTEALETLFENQNDPEFLNMICTEIECNLIEEVKDLVEEFMEIAIFFGYLDRISEIAPLDVSIRYLLTSENQIQVEIRNEFLDKMDDLEDIEDEEAFEEMKKWLQVSTNLYVIHRGKKCRRRWEHFINLNFKDPEKFRELFQMLMNPDSDEAEILLEEIEQ